ncbi:phosphoprotein phosphatase [Musa troglodytarum]|uniref:RNA polymerase II subunit B1 CTD phosphatase RPAP2 homolog n=1 Tax=Musa troglodytarum TaxID=320322 RepID=A0A9E7JQJ9_9LILI|nr:phosphoprotein phosphatase [Musa troglodytarum]
MAVPPTAATVADAVYQIQHALLDGAARSEHHLLAVATLLSRSDYEDVVVELSIADVCGYPLCRNPLPSDRQKRGRYRISLREHRVYDLEETYKYCCEACVVSSRAFSATLSSERRSDVSASKIEEILGLFRRQESSDGHLGMDGDLGISSLTIRERSDAEKGEVSLDEWIGPSNAIEGYVPNSDGNRGGIRQNQKPKKKVVDAAPVEVEFESAVILKNEDDALAYSSHGTVDASEAIAKKLEEVVLEERKAKTTKSASKSSKSKASKNSKKDKTHKVEFRSTIIVGEQVPPGPSAAAQNTPKLDYTSTTFVGDKESKTSELDSGIHMESTTGSRKVAYEFENKVSMDKGSVLKSSLKTSRSKNASRSVKWADESENMAQEERKDGLKSSTKPEESQVEDDSSLRFASAEACAAALAQAAEAVASGIAEAGDAASEAGIVILSQPKCVDEGDVEEDEDTFEFDRGYVKWPKKTVLLDTDMFDVEDSWHDTPPEGFDLKLSSFATMWMALFGWITCSSLAYIYGCDKSLQEDFLYVNGREYPHKIILKDGHSSEIRRTIDGCVCRALSGLVMELRLPVPLSTLEKTMGFLLDTMSFVDALPSLKLKQWQVIVLLFLDALSVHRLPSLASQVTNMDLLLHKVLNPAQVSSEEYDSMRDLFTPLGRSSDIQI